ncbi:DNA polymerase III subunit alpha [Owenweeksia hongkongensis]|uniref:DNA polymerase III subunit alpha n=1 Tax=Owenweeksia hongkongensis TaxID=253245 RepID=UPI003A9133E6
MLNNHSTYSFTYGCLSPKEMLDWAVESGLHELVLTDINSTAAGIEFVRLAKEANIRPILGIDFRNGTDQQFVGLAMNNGGYAELNKFLSKHQMDGNPIPAEAEFSHCFVIYPFLKAPKRTLHENEFVGVHPSQLIKLKFSEWKNRTDKLVILHTNTFRNKRDYNTHRLLRAIDQNVLLSKLPENEQAPLKDKYTTPSELESAFEEFPEIIENTRRVLEQCSIDFEFKNYHKTQNQSIWTPNGTMADDREKIHSLCQEGLQYRYGNNPSKEVLDRVDKELEVLEKRGFYSYFLINWDIVNYARRNNYFYVGRGSGANSLVAYLLRITDVDPIELDLYFERFMNMSRQSPPDFDVDFSWRDRQDVTRYIFERYPKAALLGSHTTFKYRAVTRELGKVLGLPSRDIDELSSPRNRPHNLDDMQKLVLKYGKLIENFPHNMTIHSSGILIPQQEVYQFGATFLPPKGFPTTHFDMYSAEDVGLYKFDILGQRGLGKIKDAVEIVKQNQPEASEIDIHHPRPFYHDEKIKALLREGKTMACFYVESPAMRGLLKKLRGDTYRSLVAASSIIRPGVAKSGMMTEYIKRFRQPETRKYTHPKLAEILSETYGVMVYQEDVLKVAHFFAGLTLEESDILRRGMSWKFKERNRFNEVRDKFFSNCDSFGYDPAISQEVWRQVESFGNFAFAKGHSASYAVESYQSLYLKAYFPLEYMVATINNGGGFYSVETYVNEARLHGGIIEAPCVNRSAIETSIDGTHIFLGFNLMQELEEKVIGRMMMERNRNGTFESLQNFLDRVEISLDQLVILIRINAFRTLNPDKKKLLWEAHFILGGAKKSAPVSDLFRTTPKKLEIPKLEYNQHEKAVDEIEILGFPLTSPFDLVPQLPQGTILAKDMENYIGKEVSMCGYLIHVRNLNTRSKNPQHMQFGCFFDIEGNFIDSVHFPQVAAKYKFQGRGVYLLKGKILEDFDFVNLEVTYMERLPYVDFHEV